jgi:Tc toxin complex TcA C-terminal TcB-binding domain
MVAKDAALVAEAMSACAGLEAGFRRQDEGWQHQVDVADKELKQIDKQLTAAALRKDIAVKSLDIHNEIMKQLDEAMDFYNERFSRLGLYTWTGRSMDRLLLRAPKRPR